MTLNAEEYRGHLAATARRAGLDIGEVILPREEKVPVGNLRLHYLDWGKEASPPILFLHGGALTAHTWDLCCLALRGAFHCLALDQRGHGDSDWASDADYSLVSQREDIRGFVETLDLREPVLIGQSLGAINALAYATEYPQRLSALVLIDAGPATRPAGARRIREFVSEAAEAPNLEAIIERAIAFNPRRDREILRSTLLHNLRRLPDGGWVWKYDRRRFQQLDHEEHQKARRALADRLDRVSCPTLVVRGAESDVFLEEDAVALARRLPQGRHVTIADAGHTVQGDNPNDLVLALREFLGTPT
jgi:pimeloyl-ACP methyl ester carboxylesterase